MFGRSMIFAACWAVLAAGTTATATGPLASPARAADGVIVVANSCAAQCRAAHNQCRISQKGSPACDARLQACLAGCLRR